MSIIQRISVIIPVFNSAPYVDFALRSVLASTEVNLEILVVDDGSTDGSRELVKAVSDRRVRLISNQNHGGPAAARNLALDLAVGDYVVFLDSDDIALPSCFEETAKVLAASPDVGMVGCHVQNIDQNGNLHGVRVGYGGREDELKSWMLFANVFSTSGLMVRRDVIGNLRFRDDLPVASDYEFWTRLLRSTNAMVIDQPLVQYRIHPENITHRKADLSELCVRRIAIQQLEWLGVKPMPEELEVHRSLAKIVNLPSASFIQRAEAWLLRVETANAACKFYDRGALHSVLAHYWYVACAGGADLGWATWARYHQSPISKWHCLSPAQRRLFFKSVIKGVLKQALGWNKT